MNPIERLQAFDKCVVKLRAVLLREDLKDTVSWMDEKDLTVLQFAWGSMAADWMRNDGNASGR